MSNTEQYKYYILFPNHHEGLRAHKAIKAAGIKCIISPTPREASTSCGISLLLTEANIEPARMIIEENKIKINSIVKLRQNFDGV